MSDAREAVARKAKELHRELGPFDIYREGSSPPELVAQGIEIAERIDKLASVYMDDFCELGEGEESAGQVCWLSDELLRVMYDLEALRSGGEQPKPVCSAWIDSGDLEFMEMARDTQVQIRTEGHKRKGDERIGLYRWPPDNRWPTDRTSTETDAPGEGR